MHWMPWISHATKYIRDQYPKPWSNETEKLVAFLMGIDSHSIADQLFHGLKGIRRGFIDVAAYLDFRGKWQDAHDNCDVGGDTVCYHQFNSEAMYNYKWYVPTRDIVKVSCV